MSSLAAAAATVLFSLSDPQGDSLGDGAYRLPAALSDAAQLDLRTFTASDRDGNLELKLTMGAVRNPDKLPNGFSAPVIDVFLGSGRGGAQKLADTGFRATQNRGWKYHLRVTPFTSTLEKDKSADDLPASSGVKIRVQGASILIDTGLPAGAYTYWAFTSLYDPLTPDGIAKPQATANPLRLVSAIPNAPQALEVLSDISQVGYYRSLEIPPLNEPKLETNPLLYTAIVGAALALVTSIWGLFASKRTR
jgi:C-terminal binding-module, SLH-like, of glucodextranase